MPVPPPVLACTNFQDTIPQTVELEQQKFQANYSVDFSQGLSPEPMESHPLPWSLCGLSKPLSPDTVFVRTSVALH